MSADEGGVGGKCVTDNRERETMSGGWVTTMRGKYVVHAVCDGCLGGACCVMGAWVVHAVCDGCPGDA